jgi:hypothetical protein
MYAYRAPAVDPMNAKGHPAFAHIKDCGPWAYAPAQQGGTFAYHVGASNKPEDYGAPVESINGLTFYPPKSPVNASALARPSASREDVTVVDLACGETIVILPAYLEPRKVLTGGRVGDPVTRYGLLAREVMSMLTNKEKGLPVTHPDIIALCHAAIAQTYKATSDYVDWAGWVTTGDVDPLLVGIMSLPKDAPAPAPSPSAQSGAGTHASP